MPAALRIIGQTKPRDHIENIRDPGPAVKLARPDARSAVATTSAMG